jgi:hypothetical protein
LPSVLGHHLPQKRRLDLFVDFFESPVQYLISGVDGIDVEALEVPVWPDLLDEMQTLPRKLFS